MNVSPSKANLCEAIADLASLCTDRLGVPEEGAGIISLGGLEVRVEDRFESKADAHQIPDPDP